MNEDRDEVAGRILLGYNTDGGALMLWPIRLHRLVVRISTRFPSIYTHGDLDVY